MSETERRATESGEAGAEAERYVYDGDSGALPQEDLPGDPKRPLRGVRFCDRTALVQKVSFHFAKQGSSIFFSHHDLMRHFERALRRADLAARLTDGFNPRPRMVFPHPLSVGVASECEEIEIEFAAFTDPDVAFARLKAAVEPAVELKGYLVLPAVKRGRIVTSSEYTITGWLPEATPEQARAAVERLLARAEIVVTRGHAEKARPMDIRPLIAGLRVEGGSVIATLLHNEAGMGRADEIGHLLTQELNLRDSVLQITRTKMELA